MTWTDPDTHFLPNLPRLSSPKGSGTAHIYPARLWLLTLSPPKSKFIQYIDDLRLCSLSLRISPADALTLLNFLSGDTGPSETQPSTPQVTYVGLTAISPYTAITLDRKGFSPSRSPPWMNVYPSKGCLGSYTPGSPLSPFLLIPCVREPLHLHVSPSLHRYQALLCASAGPPLGPGPTPSRLDSPFLSVTAKEGWDLPLLPAAYL